MKNKILVFIIPGASLRTIPLIGEPMTRRAERLNTKMIEENWVFDLAKYIKANSDLDTEIFHWSQGITKIFSVLPAARKLADIINNLQDDRKIVLFGKSMGGVVAYETLRRIRDQSRVLKLICVGTPHSREKMKVPEHVEFVNIFSPKDKLQGLAKWTINLGFGKRKVNEAENIELDDLGHFCFNRNITIHHEGVEKKMFDLYIELIQE